MWFRFSAMNVELEDEEFYVDRFVIVSSMIQNCSILINYNLERPLGREKTESPRLIYESLHFHRLLKKDIHLFPHDEKNN